MANWGVTPVVTVRLDVPLIQRSPVEDEDDPTPKCVTVEPDAPHCGNVIAVAFIATVGLVPETVQSVLLRFSDLRE